MTRRRLLLVLVGLILAAMAVIMMPSQPVTPAPLVPPVPHSRIALMSSLSLFSGETANISERIAGSGEPHPLINALRRSHQLTAIDMIDKASLANQDLLILIQPRALSPSEFAALDIFVRGGGRLLLLTDPQLVWPSAFGMTDPRGPLRIGLMDPLLAHWGLELALGAAETAQPEGLITPSPGHFIDLSKGADEPGDLCRIDSAGLIARCAIDEGAALMIADADVIHPELLDASLPEAAVNRRWLTARLGEILAK